MTEDFWDWLPKAYRDGDKGADPKFTKYNMEVAYLAGSTTYKELLNKSEARLHEVVVYCERVERRLKDVNTAAMNLTRDLVCMDYDDDDRLDRDRVMGRIMQWRNEWDKAMQNNQLQMQPEQGPMKHGGRPMTLRECMEAEEPAQPEQEPVACQYAKDVAMPEYRCAAKCQYAQPEQEQWDAIPDAFNEWWDADYDDTGNPYRKDSPAYWAWSGWKAASKQPAQEPVAWMYHGIRHDDTPHERPSLIWKPEYMDVMSAEKGAKATPLYTTPRQWQGLTNGDIAEIAEKLGLADVAWVDLMQAIERRLKSRNTRLFDN